MSKSEPKHAWADDGEYQWDVVIEDWGPTPGRVTLVLRTYLGTPVQTIYTWQRSISPIVATGGQRAMQRLLHELEVAGARYRLMSTEGQSR